MRSKNVLPIGRLAAALVLLFLALSGARARDEAKSAERAAAEARILADLKYLAGDACEGRGIRTQGINLAADYIAQELKKAGFKPGNPTNQTYFQPFDIVGGSRLNGQPNLLVLRGPLGQSIALEYGKQFAVAGLSTGAKLTSSIVFAGYGVTSADPKYDDYGGLDVAGKVVLLLRRVPRQKNPEAELFRGGANSSAASLQSKVANAAAHKAAGVIFVSDQHTAAEENDRLMDFAYTAAIRENYGIPVLHLRRAYGNQLLRSVTGQELSDVEKEIDRTLQPAGRPLTGWTCDIQTGVERVVAHVKNVIGVLEGAGPLKDETVVVGAHYDHLGRGESGSLARGSKDIHYGADDNASGTVATLELARRFGAMQNRQGRRLVFMLFTGEESGLLGSAHYCRNPLYPLDKTVAMFNMDMVGRLRDDKLTVIGTGTGKGFDEVVQKVNEKHKFALATVKGMSDGFGGSDHMSFYARGIPVLFLFTGLHPQYHRPTDTWETINVAGEARIVEMAEDIVQYFATATPRPEYLRLTAAPASGQPAPSLRAGTPRLGIQFDYADEKNEGAVVQGVIDGGPAAKAGLKAGDRLIEIAGKPVKNVTSYMTVLQGFKKGDKIEVKVIRAGKEEKLTVVLE